MTIFLTDAERQYSDSAQGLSDVAQARMNHSLAQIGRGAAAVPWTDALEADTIRRLAVDRARYSVERGAILSSAAREKERTKPIVDHVARNRYL